MSYQNRKYSILTYEKNQPLIWRMQKGVQAFLVTVLTLFIGLAFKGVQNLWSQALSGKEIKIIRLAVPLPSGLAATGGLGNTGNHCYVNATLQCAKTLNSFWKVLKNPPPNQKANESAEQYQLRLQIRQKIHDILSASMSGRSVSADEMGKFCQMLHQFNPYVFRLNEAGDPAECWQVFCQLLEMSPMSTMGNRPQYGHNLLVGDRPVDFFTTLTQLELTSPYPTLVVQKSIPYGEQPLVTIEPVSEIQMRCNGALVKYVLKGFVEGNGHASAFLKEDKRWIKIDDAAVAPIKQLPEGVKQNIHLFFFEKSA